MRIVIDAHIPFIKGVLDGFAEVLYLNADEIDNINIASADALIIRTRTQCNSKLLDGTKVKFVATATAGYEHIDLNYCKENGIETYIARGCNANSVAQYIGSAISQWAIEGNRTLKGLTVGIVGWGFVGKAVEVVARKMGLNIMRNDPPITDISDHKHHFCSLDDIAQRCDIITFHTPLVESGKYSTKYLGNRHFFDRCQKQPLIINAARGGVVDEKALLSACDSRLIDGFVIDCWENEPNIYIDTLQSSFLATPHIAGYSADGKANASVMCVEALGEYFGLSLYQEQKALDKKTSFKVVADEIVHVLTKTYNIKSDSDSLKANPNCFEKLRNNYPQRREIDLVVE